MMRIETGSEITTLVHKEQLAHNRYYVSSIIDILTFLAITIYLLEVTPRHENQWDRLVVVYFYPCLSTPLKKTQSWLK